MHVGEEAAYSEGRFFAPASWQAGFDGWKERQGTILNDFHRHLSNHFQKIITLSFRRRS